MKVNSLLYRILFLLVALAAAGVLVGHSWLLLIVSAFAGEAHVRLWDDPLCAAAILAWPVNLIAALTIIIMGLRHACQGPGKLRITKFEKAMNIILLMFPVLYLAFDAGAFDFLQARSPELNLPQTTPLSHPESAPTLNHSQGQ